MCICNMHSFFSENRRIHIAAEQWWGSQGTVMDKVWLAGRAHLLPLSNSMIPLKTYTTSSTETPQKIPRKNNNKKGHILKKYQKVSHG